MQAGKSFTLALLRVAGHDVARIVRTMPILVLIAFVILLGHDVLAFGLRGLPPDARGPLKILVGLAAGFLLIHYVIAVHRFVVLDEVATRFPFEPTDRLTWRFILAWVALSLVSGVPSMLAAGVLTSRGAHWSVVAAALAVGIGMVMLALRMTVLLPAIAVGAPGATWLNAYEDTKGHAVRILLVFAGATVLSGLAGALLGIVLITALRIWASLFGLSRVMFVLVPVAIDVGGVIVVTYFVAIASRLFQVLGNRVMQPQPG